ncbi:MAG: response regulator transcription factor [Lapillicoccus sp.]
MTPPPRVLLVEDDQQLARMLTGLLLDDGYDVDVAGDGQRALHLGMSRVYDVIVMDRGLPALDGLDVLARLRRSGCLAAVLVLSARGTPTDRVLGLETGADDYLTKPFDVDELLARLRALRRRHEERADRLDVPGGTLDLGAREVETDSGTSVSLSEREHVLLSQLARFPRRVFSRGELLAYVFDGVEDQGVIDTYVHYLRRKLGKGVVATVRGVGYRLGSR